MIKFAFSFVRLGPRHTFYDNCELDSYDTPGLDDNDKSDNLIEILPPCMSPFTSCPLTGKIKAMKIFGTVKLEFLKVVKVHTKAVDTNLEHKTPVKYKKKLLDNLTDEKLKNNSCRMYKELCNSIQHVKKQYGSRLSMRLKKKLCNQLQFR